MVDARAITIAFAAMLLLAAAPAIDAADVRRGALAVGDRTSEQPALRAEAQPGPAFRLGAVFRAWTNSAAAVRFDAANSTGDGGDAEALAVDCGDERIAFASLEEVLHATGMAEAEVARSAGAPDPAIVAAWRARRSMPPKPCR